MPLDLTIADSVPEIERTRKLGGSTGAGAASLGRHTTYRAYDAYRKVSESQTENITPRAVPPVRTQG